MGMEQLSAEKINVQIADHHRGLITRLFVFNSISSTNDYLLTEASRYPDSNLVCVAEEQTAGRGRLGRRWVSPFAENIYVSLLWHFDFPLSALAGLNIVVGVSVAEAIRVAAGVNGIQLKWPNDIYWQGRKLGGILIEVCADVRDHCAVVIGIGLNVSMSDVEGKSIEKPWGNLAEATSSALSRNTIIGTLIDTLIVNLIQLQKHGAASFVKKWNTLDYLAGKPTRVQSGPTVVQGVAVGVNELGQLLLKQNDGSQLTVGAGEASVTLL